jgi:hypothetical protein
LVRDRLQQERVTIRFMLPLKRSPQTILLCCNRNSSINMASATS